MPAFIDWGSLFKWQPPATQPAPPPPQHEPPSPAADDPLASFVTPDAYLVVATVAAAVLGALGTWLLVRRLHPLGPAPIDAQVAARLQHHDDAIDALRGELREAVRTTQTLDQQAAELAARTTQTLDQQAASEAVGAQIDALEGRFQETLEQRLQAVEAQTQATLESRAAALEAWRRRLGQRVDDVADGVRAKVNKEAFDALYAALGRRVDALEAGVRLLDGRQLDQEACGVAQRALGHQLRDVETVTRALDARATGTAQRLDGLEDTLRVVDCRGRAAAPRLDAVEDNVGAVDGQATLLAHDVARGRASLDRLARQVRALPGPDRLRALADDWEARFGALEAHVAGELAEAGRKQLEAAAAATPPEPPALSWSPLVAQEIEPAGPLYAAAAATTPHDHVYHGFAYPADMTMPPTPSPSDRSHSSHSSRLSFIPTPTPGASRRKKLDEAGFKEPTFASRQRLFHARTSPSAA